MSLVLLYNSAPVAPSFDTVVITTLPSTVLTTTDPFTRTSTTTLGSTPDGYAWTAHTGTWGTNGTQAYMVSTGDAGLATIDAGVVNADISAANPTGALVNGYWHLVIAFTDLNNFVSFEIDSNNTGRFYKTVGGTRTQMGDTPQAGAVGAVVRLTRNGGQFTAYVNGTQVLQTDSSHTNVPNGTRVGIMYSSNFGTTPALRWDDFTATIAQTVTTKSGADTILPVVVDSSALNRIGLAQDTLTPALVETAAIAISGLVTKSAADTTTPAIVDTVSARMAGLSRVETVTPTITETTAFGTVAVSASDVDAPAIADTSLLNSSGLASDTFTPVVLDASQPIVKTDVTSDPFTRTSTTSLGSTPQGYAWTAHTGTWGTNGTQAYSVSGIDTDIATIDAGLVNSDVQAICTPDAANFGYWGLICSYTDLNNFVWVEIDPNQTLFLTKRVAGVQTSLGSTFAGTVDGAKIRLTRVGGQFTVYYNGVQVLQTAATHTDVPNATRVGMRFGRANASMPALRWDDFTANVSSVNAKTASDTLVPKVAYGFSPYPGELYPGDTYPDDGASQLVKTDANVTIDKSASDSLTPVIVDNVFARTHSLFSSDTLTPSIIDTSAFGTVAVAASDTDSPSVVDSVSLLNSTGLAQDTIVSSVSETAAVQISGLVLKSVADTTTPAIVDAVFARQSGLNASDTVTPTVTETSIFGTVVVSASDNDSPAIVDTSGGITQNTPFLEKTGSDTLTPGVVDTSALFASGLGADLVAPAIVDSSSVVITGTITKSSADTLTPVLNDQVMVTLSKTADDTFAPVLTDIATAPAMSGGLNLSASDTLAPSITDASTRFISLSRTDTLAPSVVDSSTFAPVAVTSADSLSPSVTDASFFGTVAVTATDVDAPTIVDTGSVVQSLSSIGADVFAPSVSDTSSLVQTGTTLKTAADTTTPAVVDSTVSVARSLDRTDTLTPTLGETVVIFVVRTTLDSLTPTMFDAGTISGNVVTVVTKTAADTVKATFAEVATRMEPAPVTFRVWNGTSFVVGQVKVWNGNNWHVPAIKIWNGNAWI